MQAAGIASCVLWRIHRHSHKVLLHYHCMKIDGKEIQHLARLARLKVNTKDEEGFARDLSEIVQYFATLTKVETDKISPHEEDQRSSPLRIDRVTPFGREKALIEDAPDHEDRWVKVPAVFEE